MGQENNFFPCATQRQLSLQDFGNNVFESPDKFRMPAEKNLNSVTSLHYIQWARTGRNRSNGKVR